MRSSRNGNGARIVLRVVCPRCGGEGPPAPSATEAVWLATDAGWRSMLVIGGPPQFICPHCLAKVGTLK